MSANLPMLTAQAELAQLQGESEKFEHFQRVAKMYIASGFFKDVPQVAQAATKMLAGDAIGLEPIASLSHIHFINGRLTYEAVALGAALKRAGYKYRSVEATDERCEIAFVDPDGFELGSTSFSIEQANTAGLTGKGPWAKYPGDMLWAKALSRGCRRFCPDVFATAAYTPEDLRDSEPGHALDFISDEAVAAAEAEQAENHKNQEAELLKVGRYKCQHYPLRGRELANVDDIAKIRKMLEKSADKMPEAAVALCEARIEEIIAAHEDEGPGILDEEDSQEHWIEGDVDARGAR